MSPRAPATLCLLGLMLLSRSSRADAPPAPEPPPITAPLTDLPLAGDKDELIYLRDRADFLRLYPHARLSLDGHGFFGARVNTLSKSDAGVDLGPRFLVRQARFGLGGELLQRTAFQVDFDLVANPAIDGARAVGTKTKVALANAWALLDAGRGFWVTLGHQPAPFSLENRTDSADLPMMERNLAIRGFVVPGNGSVLGAALSGRTQYSQLRWDAGVFAAESLSPGQLSRRFEGIGRVGWRPWAARGSSKFRDVQLGVSGRYGSRLRRDATDDAPAITTGQGFALFRPTFSEGNETVHIVPTGQQWAVGGELRVPVHGFVFRSEAYFVNRDTEELSGPDLTWNAARRGRLSGLGWYVEASCWILQMAGLIDGEPPRFGEAPRADHLELAQLSPAAKRYGFEVALIAAGVNAHYDGAQRNGDAPASGRATNIDVYQLGLAVNYWQTSRFRLSVDYDLYVAPHAGTEENLAVVPGNLSGDPVPSAHTLGELGGRVSVMF